MQLYLENVATLRMVHDEVDWNSSCPCAAMLYCNGGALKKQGSEGILTFCLFSECACYLKYTGHGTSDSTVMVGTCFFCIAQY